MCVCARARARAMGLNKENKTKTGTPLTPTSPPPSTLPSTPPSNSNPTQRHCSTLAAVSLPNPKASQPGNPLRGSLTTERTTTETLQQRVRHRSKKFINAATTRIATINFRGVSVSVISHFYIPRHTPQHAPSNSPLGDHSTQKLFGPPRRPGVEPVPCLPPLAFTFSSPLSSKACRWRRCCGNSGVHGNRVAGMKRKAFLFLPATGKTFV